MFYGDFYIVDVLCFKYVLVFDGEYDVGDVMCYGDGEMFFLFRVYVVIYYVCVGYLGVG